jgi:hypothetical protein
MFPNSVARNRVQPDGRLIEEEHPRPMQRGLGDFQASDHAAGVFAHKAAAVGSQAHELQCLPDARLLLAVRQVVEFGEDEQVLVTGERTVHGDRLRHITDGAANVDRLGGYGETGHARLARRGRQQRGEHLDRGGLASPVGAEQAEDLTGVDRKGQSIDRRKCAEAASKALILISRTMSLICGIWQAGVASKSVKLQKSARATACSHSVRDVTASVRPIL